jgi:hypothetical protein
MIKFKFLNREAYTTPAGYWKATRPEMEKLLNEVASADKLKGYNPDIELAMLEKAKEIYPKLKVIEHTKKKYQKIPDNAIF